MMDDFLDDRDRDEQGTLDIGEAAARTTDRAGELVGSAAFADGRDHDRDDRGDQTSLFGTEEEYEDQLSLGGGMASISMGPEWDDEDDAGEDTGGAFGPMLSSEERHLGLQDAEDEFPAVAEAAAFDVSLSPGEAFRGVGTNERTLSDGTRVSGDDMPARTDEPDDLIARDLERTRREEAAERSGALGESGDQTTGLVELDLDPEAASAAMQAARFGERRSDDLDRDALKAARGNLSEARQGNGSALLTESQADELSDAVAEFGIEASPSQRPDGYDDLEAQLFGVESGDDDEVEYEEDDDDEADGDDLETEVIEFHRKADAQSARAELPDEALTDRFDGRHKSIEVILDRVEDHQLNRVRGIAADSRSHEATEHGQIELTDAEKRRIDFSKGRANTMHARSVKGVMRGHGIDDWVAFYDPTLSVDEHRQIAKDAKRDEVGTRRDTAGEERFQIEREARAQRRVEDEECGHAREGARRGHQEAVDMLVNECGWSRSEAQALKAEAESGQMSEAQFNRIVDAELERSRSTGRFVSTPPERVPGHAGVDRARGSGLFVSRDRVDADIGRDRETGRFVAGGRL